MISFTVRKTFILLLLVYYFKSVMLKKQSLPSLSPVRLKIGVLVPKEDKGVGKLKLTQAVKKHNKNSRVTFEGHIVYTSQDSYFTLQSVCKVLEKGVVALTALNLGKTEEPVSSLASSLGIPLLLVDRTTSAGRSANGSGVNLVPQREQLGAALSDLILELDMDGAAMFYDRKEDILLLTSLLDKIGFFHGGSRLYQIKEQDSVDDMLKKLVVAKQQSHTDLILLSCSTINPIDFLEAVLKSGWLETGNRILLPCLGLDRKSLEDYKHLGATIMVFGMEKGMSSNLERAAAEDALTGLAAGITKVQAKGGSMLPESLSCGGGGFWQAGKAIIEHVRNTSFVGKTGVVNIDKSGNRRDFRLGLWQVIPDGWDRVGTWSSSDGMMMNGRLGRIVQNQMLINYTVVVSAILSAPFTMLKDKPDQYEGNDKYEGFAVDLIKEISNLVKFNFSISIADGYGSKNKRTGEWDGMIREILDERAHMAIGDLTINTERAEAVDFSMPFLNSGISILYVSTPKKAVDLFSFMRPFSLKVWALVLVGGLAVTICVNIVARYSPFETLDFGSTEGESPFVGVNNCIWFTVASWMGQGCDFPPRAYSTRLVASFYWFFTLIMISSYTANLAAFLTIERMDLPISSAEDLAKQNLIKYGAVRGGSTAGFFHDFAKYKKMSRAMNQWEGTMVKSNNDGLTKVLTEEGQYAFFMESAAIEYHIERNCKLTQVGGLLNTNSYGVALSRGSKLRSLVSAAIIRLREEGVIAKLKEKWWKQERGGGMCDEEEDSTGSVNELDMANVGGIFLVLLIGLVLGCALAAAEVYWNKYKKGNMSNSDSS